MRQHYDILEPLPSIDKRFANSNLVAAAAGPGAIAEMQNMALHFESGRGALKDAEAGARWRKMMGA